MGLALTIARRSLQVHPGRALFSILGVAVGIATVVAVFTLDHSSVLSRTEKLDPDFGADLEVRPSAELADPRAELLALEGVAGVAAFFQNDVRARALAGEAGTEVRVRMVALERASARTLGVYHVEDGEDLDRAGPGTVLVGRRLAEDLGLSIGDRLTLAPPVRAARQECIEGELRDVSEPAGPPEERVFRVAGVLAAEGIGRKAQGRMVVTDYDEGRALLRDVFVESQFWLKRERSVDLEALETELARGFTFERNEAKAVGQMADERAFRNGVRVAGLFALLLGLFVIFHTLSMSLVERVREVGSLHALAASRTQIARVFFSEACVIAFLAGILGLAGGLALARALLLVGITTLGVTGPTPMVVPWSAVLLLVFLGVAIALLGAIYPILRVRSTDVVASLRGDEPGRRGVRAGFHLFSTVLLVAVVPAAFFHVVPVVGAAGATLVGTILVGLVVLGLVIGLPLFFPGAIGRLCARVVLPFERRFTLGAKLASRALERNSSRVGASIAAVALVTAAFVGLKGMTRSLAAEVEVWGRTAAQSKVWIEGLPDADVDELARVFGELPGVVGVEAGDARAFPSFLLLGLEVEELAGFGPLARDPELLRKMREGQGMLVTERLARQRNLVPGDSVLIRTSGHGAQAFEVLAITDEYGYFFRPDERAYGVVDRRFLKRFFCVDVQRTNTLAVRFDGRTDRGAVEATARARFPAIERLRVYDGREVIGEMLVDLTRDFVLFDIILFLTAVLAGLGVLNGQLLSALERKKELGVLRALGTTRDQIAGAVLLESAVIGLAGGGLGLIVGAGLTPVLVVALRALSGLALPLRSAGPWLWIALASAVVLALLAGAYPIWRMNRFDAVRAVRTG